MVQLTNFPNSHGTEPEVFEVYQRCILVSGRCTTGAIIEDENGSVVASVIHSTNASPFPEQRWPMCRGNFKAIVLLSPGLNKVIVTAGQDDTCEVKCPPSTPLFIILTNKQISVRYTPLLQTPPLHLAIMIAKDSPLLIDCPPAKFGDAPNTPSNLDVAIAKFRMTAYMWQALTAEELRDKGLGRRSFRLEEEWTADTLSRRSLHSPTTASVAKVHLIRTEKTVAELRDVRNKDKLHAIFTAALHAHGAPFTPQANPVVAGLILDAHYDATNTKLVLAHAAQGTHDPAGLSLAVFGSHLTYAWPRFFEEVPHCLLDDTPVGDAVANENGGCGVMWKACSFGQDAFLHEVGRAFGGREEDDEDIKLLRHSREWPMALLGCTRAPGGGLEPERWRGGEWDDVDALRLRALRHFWMPGDVELSKEPPTVRVDDGGDGEEVERLYLEVKSEAGIARVLFCQSWRTNRDHDLSIEEPAKSVRYLREDLEIYGQDILELEVTAMNGMQCIIEDIWHLFKNRSGLQVPGTEIRLIKQSISYVCAREGIDEDEESDQHWRWAVMLRKRDSDGNLTNASKIDLYVGGSLDGAVVHYNDGTQIPCGERGPNGNDPRMCAHQARRLVIPKGVEVSKVAVTRVKRSGELIGLRMWLSNGKAMGALNYTPSYSVVELLSRLTTCTLKHKANRYFSAAF